MKNVKTCPCCGAELTITKLGNAIYDSSLCYKCNNIIEIANANYDLLTAISKHIAKNYLTLIEAGALKSDYDNYHLKSLASVFTGAFKLKKVDLINRLKMHHRRQGLLLISHCYSSLITHFIMKGWLVRVNPSGHDIYKLIAHP